MKHVLWFAPFAVLLVVVGMQPNPAVWEPPEGPPIPIQLTFPPALPPTEAPALPTATQELPTATPLPTFVPVSTLPPVANPTVWEHLALIRECESHNNYSAVSSNGLFYGAYQFLLSTWRNVGGQGLPSEASPAEQDERAYYLYTHSNPYSQWPHCA